ncbi:glycosyltransferase family 4 protein [Paenibacillus allorhizosphaerae]|uniref:Glycosyltransferase family 4 protein n=1 Tax=Paenibacillus allorhizosphaerae TaxID=2849866 RepID=A0ABN7TIH3_9BACL|nr:glycosyltransferase [Paenibacillus allorhizosphaerae]CAG7632435.1 hypothetical protein PAECIP111802_01845 [Paenibacillus allorhizosphaerae]
MNVLILTKYFSPIRNGLSDHTELIRDLFKQNCSSVTVLCQQTAERSLAKPLNIDDQDIFEYVNYPDFIRQLSYICKRKKPDVVLFQYVPHMWGKAGVAPFAALLPLWIKCVYKVPVVSFMHELHYDWSFKPKQLLLALCHRIQLLLIGGSSRFQIVTNHKREHALKRFWNGKIYRIPAGNVSGRKDDALRTPRYPWPYITWFGTLSELQRLEELVWAFAGLAGKHKELRLVLVGGFNVKASRVAEIKRYAEEQGFAERLVIRGFVDDDELSDILYGSVVNVFVESSGPSGRRTVVAAYLRSGRALVAINGSETDPEFIHGENVLLAGDRDESALAEQIRCVLERDSVRKRLEKGARSLYQQHYSDEALSEKLTDMLSHALRGYYADHKRGAL